MGWSGKDIDALVWAIAYRNKISGMINANCHSAVEQEGGMKTTVVLLQGLSFVRERLNLN